MLFATYALFHKFERRVDIKRYFERGVEEIKVKMWR
jgi:hypothetical protein